MARGRSPRHDGPVFGRKKDEGGIPGLSSLGGTTPSGRVTGIPGTETLEREPESPTTTSTPNAGASTSQYGSTPQLGASTAEPWEIGPWTIRLFVIVFFAAFAVLFASEEHRRMNDPKEKASRGEVTLTSGDSLVKTANLRKALNAVKAKSPANATVESLRITPTRVDVTVAQSDGAQFELSVDPSYEVSKDTYPASEPEGLPFSKIPTAVPERLIKTIESKLGLKPADLDYVLLNPRKDFEGKRDDEWGAYYSKPPLHNDATAALDGTDVRLIGTPDAATRKTMRDSARQTLASLRQAERQIKSSGMPKSMQKTSLDNIKRARAQALKSLKEAQ